MSVSSQLRCDGCGDIQEEEERKKGEEVVTCSYPSIVVSFKTKGVMQVVCFSVVIIWSYITVLIREVEHSIQNDYYLNETNNINQETIRL